MVNLIGGRRAFAILGGCVLLPYNCLLLGQPYFSNHAFKGMQFPFTSMIAYSVCLCLGQGFLTFRGEYFSLDGRMWAAFVGTTIVCVALLLVTLGAHAFGGVGMYLAGLASVAALGVLNSLMQTAILGLAGSMGQEMSASCMLGFGISGILSLVLSLLVQAIDKPANVSEEMNGFIVTVMAFAFCILYTIASAWVYRALSKNVPAAVEAIVRLDRRRMSLISPDAARALNLNDGSSLMPVSEQNGGKGGALPSEARAVEILAKQDGVEAPASPVDVGAEASTLQRTLGVVREVAPQALNVLLVFSTTMTIFPGVMILWQPLPGSLFLNSSQLFGTLLIGCFQVFDVVGRSFAGCAMKCISPSRLWIFVVLRLLFVPLFIFGQRRPEWSVLWGSDAGRLFLSASLAATNGLLATLAMMYGPQCCPSERREVAGIAMSCTMVTGIFSGSMLALLTQL